MQVTTLRSTPEAEKLVAQAARGDYYDGFVGDADYDELMESVGYEDRHVDAVHEIADRVEGDEKAVAIDFGRTDGPGSGTLFTERWEDHHSPETAYRQYALLERLFRRGHWGPYEHPQITLAIEGVSRSCMAQITRHRHASFDVQSQRYVDFSEKDDPVKVPKSLTDPDHATRGEGNVEVDHREVWKGTFEDLSDDLFDEYEQMIENGVPPEDARFLLPIGTKVNFTVSVNARMLLHIANLRERGDSQWEIREMTNRMLDDEFKEWMPMTYHLWREHGPTEISP